MFGSNLVLKILPYLLGVLLLGGVLHTAYSWAHGRGEAKVQAKWNVEKENYAKAIATLQKKLAVKEEAHRKETIRIANEISESQRIHDVELATANAVYERRLRLSETRASVYQRKAQGGASERASLASHTAKLDASLEEGRSLVRELRTTLRLRDEQLTAVGEQLINDRKLFDDSRK